MNLTRKQWPTRALKRASATGLLTVLLCVANANSEELQKSGDFLGHWTAVGTAETLVLDESRSATILRLQGTIDIESSHGLTRALQTDCVGLNVRDDGSTGTGRCVWTDSDGDRMISEVTGELSGTDSKVRGRFIGGTGKYEGLEGAYQLDWRYLRAIEEEGTIHGYSTSLSGNWTLP